MLIHRKVLLPVVIITSFLLILGSCASNPDQKAEDSREGDLHYQMGVTYLTKGNVEMALFELSKAVRLKPRDAEVRFALGTIYLFKGEPERAIGEFKQVIQLNPSHSDAYNNLGAAYVRIEKWDLAIDACQTALDQIGYQTPEKALTIIGWSYYKKNDPVNSIDYLKRALEIKPDSPDTANKMSEVYISEGRLDKAQAILADLVTSYPTYVSARLNLGITYYKMRDMIGAKKEFHAVLRLTDSKSDNAKLARGYLDLLE